MEKYKKLLALLLSAVMAVSLLAGCGKKDSGKTDGPVNTPTSSAPTQATEKDEPAQAATPAGKEETLEPVTLIMYLLGDRPLDGDEVFEKINDRLKEEINATIEVKYMSWSEYEQKYSLLFASGEDWDIIFTADWCFYNAMATKQGFYEITREALEKYAPRSAATMYEDAWEEAKISGKVYMMPMNYKEITAYVYMARGDLMDKYNISSVSSLEDAEAYLDAVAKNEKTFIPLDVGSDYDKMFIFDRMWQQANLAEGIRDVGPWQVMASINETDPNAEVKGNYEQEQFAGVISRLQDWRNRGFWSRNAVVNTQNNTESFQAGKSALALMNINTAKSVYAKVSAEHPEWDVRVFDAQSGVPAIVNSYLANGMSIFSKSRNPERALMALDYLRNDELCNNLFCYGIEGKHWEAVGDKGLRSLEASAGYPYDSNCNWGVRNDAYWRTIAEGGIPNFNELNEVWLATGRSSRYQAFTFDDSAVKNEIAAMGEIFNSDYKLLCLGFTDDVEGDIEKLAKKLEAAGADRVYAEIQRQVIEFNRIE